jgi:hypothetical protein
LEIEELSVFFLAGNVQRSQKRLHYDNWVSGYPWSLDLTLLLWYAGIQQRHQCLAVLADLLQACWRSCWKSISRLIDFGVC